MRINKGIYNQRHFISAGIERLGSVAAVIVNFISDGDGAAEGSRCAVVDIGLVIDAEADTENIRRGGIRYARSPSFRSDFRYRALDGNRTASAFHSRADASRIDASRGSDCASCNKDVPGLLLFGAADAGSVETSLGRNVSTVDGDITAISPLAAANAGSDMIVTTTFCSNSASVDGNIATLCATARTYTRRPGGCNRSAVDSNSTDAFASLPVAFITTIASANRRAVAPKICGCADDAAVNLDIAAFLIPASTDTGRTLASLNRQFAGISKDAQGRALATDFDAGAIGGESALN